MYHSGSICAVRSELCSVSDHKRRKKRPDKGFSNSDCWPNVNHEETLLVKQMVTLKVVVPTNYYVPLSYGFVVIYKLVTCKY